MYLVSQEMLGFLKFDTAIYTIFQLSNKLIEFGSMLIKRLLRSNIQSIAYYLLK